jgi:electron transfer flavoprotein alpha subunit
LDDSWTLIKVFRTNNSGLYPVITQSFCPTSRADPSFQNIEYIEAPITGEDITQAEIIVSVGQGIGGPEHIPMIEEVAKSLGGVIACSRPVVDRNWLPRDRQVGISGKTVKPKVYIAIGISGAFQHITAMQGSETIIAINKDPRAPIFGVADYGIVDDFQNVIPILKEKIKGIK